MARTLPERIEVSVKDVPEVLAVLERAERIRVAAQALVDDLGDYLTCPVCLEERAHMIGCELVALRDVLREVTR